MRRWHEKLLMEEEEVEAQSPLPMMKLKTVDDDEEVLKRSVEFMEDRHINRRRPMPE